MLVRVWFLILALLASRQLGSLRKIDDQFHKVDLSVKTSFSQSAKKESTRNILITIDLEKSERRHFGSLSTPRSRRRSYLNGKLNYYRNSLACFQLQRHAISGGIHPNPDPVLRHNSRRENKRTRKPKPSCWSLNARSVANKGRELISRLTYKPCDLVAITETWLDQSIERAPKYLLAPFRSTDELDRTRHGGGILLVCNIELGCVRRLDFETDCEILWCEISIPSQGSKFLVGVFYGPPSSDAVF